MHNVDLDLFFQQLGETLYPVMLVCNAVLLVMLAVAAFHWLRAALR